MRKAILCLVIAIIIGIISPQLVKALTNSSLSIINSETGDLVIEPLRFDIYALGSDNRIGKRDFFTSYNGYIAIPNDFSPDDTTTITYVLFSGGFLNTTGSEVLRPNQTTKITLVPIVHCGDRVCTKPQENLASCPQDCSQCPDNVCTLNPEHRINCPADCNVPKFIRGDADANGKIDTGDSYKIMYWLTQGTPITCLDAADANDDGIINQADSTWVGDYVAKRRTSLPQPFPAKGYDPTVDTLKCNQYPQ